MKKRFGRYIGVSLVVILALCAVSATVSAADITLSKSSAAITMGKSAVISVSGITDVKVSSGSDFVATVEYSAKDKKITIKGVNFGTTKIRVTSTKDKNVYKDISISVKAPKITGKFYTRKSGTDTFTFFRKDNGKNATGWNEINGKTYYIYPNGVVFDYDKVAILYNNKSYITGSKAEYSGKTSKAYILSHNNPSTKTSVSTATVLNNKIVAEWGKDNVYYGFLSPTTLIINTYFRAPGTYQYTVGTYNFYNPNATANDTQYDTKDYQFSGVSMQIDYSDASEVGKTFYEEKYLVKSLNMAFGQEGKNYTDNDGNVFYQWDDVGVEKLSLQVYFNRENETGSKYYTEFYIF